MIQFFREVMTLDKLSSSSSSNNSNSSSSY